MKTSKVLAITKLFLADNFEQGLLGLSDGPKEKFICYALNLAVDCGSIPKSDAKRLQRIIHERLGVHACLETWLKKVQGINWLKGTTPRLASDKMQTTRHAWIDALIAEFQANGD